MIDVNKEIASLKKQGLEVFIRADVDGRRIYFVQGYGLRARDLVELGHSGKLNL